MQKERKIAFNFYTEYPENPPDWYREAGLHDACIAYEFPFDYLLEICVPHQKQFHLKLRFDRAEVDRT